MVISFSVLEARRQLEEKGFVYTLRKNKRKKVGYDWYNYFRGDTKKGVVHIYFFGDFPIGGSQRLEPYVKYSGFDSLEEWLEKAKKSRYLYRVILIKEKILNDII